MPKFVPEAVLVIDPGLRSGWAMWSDGVFICGVEDPDGIQDLMAQWAESWGPRGLLVVEKFTITAQTGKYSPQPEPLELTGVARYLARIHRCVFKQQMPADAKRIAPDAQLRALGWYTTGRGGEDHGRDATRHLVLCLAQLGLLKLRRTT